jgi:hypothetical protein
MARRLHGKPRMRNHISSCAFALILTAAASYSGAAQAQGERYVRYEPSAYPLEIEPHFAFGPDNVYGTGVGAGLRVSVPIVSSLLVRVPDNLAITFGGDVIHYPDCFFTDLCGANYLLVPVAGQWNIFLARRLSIFGELGAFAYKGFFDVCGPGAGPGCLPPSDFGVLPTIAIGGRLHFGDNAAFTARFGYPTITLGLSLM